MNRRQTLGSLDSQMNSVAGSQIPQPNKGRPSLGAGLTGRPSLGPALRKQPNNVHAAALSTDLNHLSLQDSRTSIGARQSNPMARRSSAYGNGRQSTSGGAGVGVKDPRNIRDKQWQLAAIRNLVKFVLEAGYDRPISPKILTAPSIKDFQHIFMFLYNRLDPGYTWQKKFEEDVLVLVKCLKYPYADSITKSTLMAVGSMHSWPSLLALLIWMVELIMVCETVENEMEGQEGAADPDRLFTDFLVRSYDQYMLGQTDYETLEAEMHENFRANQEATMVDIEKLEIENAALEDKLAELTGEPSPLSKLQQKKAEILDDTHKVKKWIDTLTTKKNQLTEQLETLRSEFEKLSKESVEVVAEKEELQVIVDSQEISPADVDRMNAERDQLSKNLEQFTEKNEALTNLNWGLEIEVQKKLDSVEKLSQNYNAKAFKLQMIPVSAPNSHGFNFELSINPNAKKAEDMTSIDLRGPVRTALINLKSRFKNEIVKCEDDFSNYREEFDKAVDMINEKMEELKVIEERIQVAQEKYECSKEQSNAELDAMMSEIETLDREIRRVKVERSRGLFDYQKDLREQEIEHDNILRRYNETKDRMMKQANKVTEDVKNFKRQLMRPLEELKMAVDRDYQMLQTEFDANMPRSVNERSQSTNLADESFADFVDA